MSSYGLGFRLLTAFAAERWSPPEETGGDGRRREASPQSHPRFAASYTFVIVVACTIPQNARAFCGTPIPLGSVPLLASVERNPPDVRASHPTLRLRLVRCAPHCAPSSLVRLRPPHCGFAPHTALLRRLCVFAPHCGFAPHTALLRRLCGVTGILSLRDCLRKISSLANRTSYIVHRTSYIAHRTSYIANRTSYIAPRTSHLAPRTSHAYPNFIYLCRRKMQNIINYE